MLEGFLNNDMGFAKIDRVRIIFRLNAKRD